MPDSDVHRSNDLLGVIADLQRRTEATVEPSSIVRFGRFRFEADGDTVRLVHGPSGATVASWTAPGQ